MYKLHSIQAISDGSYYEVYLLVAYNWVPANYSDSTHKFIFRHFYPTKCSQYLHAYKLDIHIVIQLWTLCNTSSWMDLLLPGSMFTSVSVRFISGHYTLLSKHKKHKVYTRTHCSTFINVLVFNKILHSYILRQLHVWITHFATSSHLVSMLFYKYGLCASQTSMKCFICEILQQ